MKLNILFNSDNLTSYLIVKLLKHVFPLTNIAEKFIFRLHFLLVGMKTNDEDSQENNDVSPEKAISNTGNVSFKLLLSIYMC